jgi:hypothetical protein
MVPSSAFPTTRMPTAPTAVPTLFPTNDITNVYSYFLEYYRFNGTVGKYVGSLPTAPGTQFSISMWITTSTKKPNTLGTVLLIVHTILFLETASTWMQVGMHTENQG